MLIFRKTTNVNWLEKYRACTMVSKRQITLHTGVYYTQHNMQTFCAVTDSLDHSPAGIWACLSPILDKIFEENKDIDTVHFYSDGPTKSKFLLVIQ